MKLQPSVGIAIAAISVCFSVNTQAQEKGYPNRLITIVVPMGAGGTSDVIARTIQPMLTKNLGQNIVIENKAGANGVLGEEFMFRQKPDGYMVMMSSASVAVNPYLTKINYDPAKFVPVGQLGINYLVMSANNDVKANNMQELLALIRSQPPGKFNYSSWGVGGVGHLAAELFNLEAKVKLTHIPYKTSPAAITGTIGGETEVTFQGGTLSLPQIKAGKLKGIAIVGPTRLAEAPEIPTMAEVGLPGVRLDSWFGMFLPPGTPKAIVDRLHEASQAALSDPETLERLKARGVVPKGGTTEEFAAHFQSELLKYKRIVTEAKITAD